MNAPAPGWQPDPTQRHEYRYWDGARWTDDVSDGGVTSVDPVAGAQAPSGYPSGDATVPFTPGPTESFGAPPGGAGMGAGPGTYGSGGYPPYGGAPMPPGQPVKKGPSTGLLVGIAVVVVALIAGLAFMLTSGDDDDSDTAAGDASTTTTASGTSETTADTSSDTTFDAGDIGGEDAIVDAMASGIEQSAGGAVTHEQAVCVAQGMVDRFGTNGIIEMGVDASGNESDPFAGMSEEDRSAIFDIMADCVPGLDPNSLD